MEWEKGTGNQMNKAAHSISPVVIVDGNECVVHDKPTRLAGVGAKGGQQREEGSGLLQGQGLMLNHALDNVQAGHLGGFIPVIMRNTHMLHMYLQRCQYSFGTDASLHSSALEQITVIKVFWTMLQVQYAIQTHINLQRTHRPECEHAVKPLVFELQVQLRSDVCQRLEHLETHTLEQSVEFGQEKEQLVSKSVRV